MKKKEIIGFSLILVFAIIAGRNTYIKSKGLEENKQLGVGKILSITSKRSPNMIFEYYVNGKRYTNNGGSTQYSRENDFHLLEYDSENPENSNLKIKKKSINPLELIENGTFIMGHIDKIIPVFNSHADLYINYQFGIENFSFRTRLNRDSLPCGNIEECLNKKINLKVSEKFPLLNDLYYKSYDRQKALKEIKGRFE